MSKVIALVNQKGGVTKSTSTVNLGAGLAANGRKVLLIDADSQGNLTQMLGWRQPDELNCTLSTLMEKAIMDKTILPGEGILHHSEGIDLVPANIELSGLELALVNTMSRGTILRNYINEVKTGYDYVLIDCAPSLGMMTINALTAADSVIIPVQAHYLSMKGLDQLLHSIKRIQRQLNPQLKIDGILPTMVQQNTRFSAEMLDILRNNYGAAIRVFPVEIPHSIRAAEMSAEGKSIYKTDPHGKVAAAYRELTKAVLELDAREQQKNNHREVVSDGKNSRRAWPEQSR